MWYECVSAPSWPNARSSWNGKAVRLGKSIKYNCDDGFYFETGRDVADVKAKCRDDGQFDMSGLPECVESKRHKDM